MTLAFLVFGNSATNSTAAGRNGLPRREATIALRSLASAADGVWLGRSTPKQTRTCPFAGSGTPIAAASSTPGCSTRIDSTSAGPSRLPAILIVSSERPSVPQAIVIDRGPVAMHPDAWKARPVGLFVALGVL